MLLLNVMCAGYWRMSSVTLCCVCRLLENECCNSVVCTGYWRMSAVALLCCAGFWRMSAVTLVLCVQVTGE